MRRVAELRAAGGAVGVVRFVVMVVLAQAFLIGFWLAVEGVLEVIGGR